MILNKSLLLMYRYLFLAGFILEPVWGYYLGVIMGMNDSVFIRITGGIVSLICCLLTWKPNFFIKNVSWIILTCSVLFFAGRYHLMHLNPGNWNYIIDLYTVFILWLIIVPTKSMMYLLTPLFMVPALFFPFYDYVTFSLMFCIAPLVGSLKWVFFDLSDKYEKAQIKIKESNLLIGSQKTMNVLSHQINNHLEKINLNNELLKLAPNPKMNESIHDSIKTLNTIMFSYNIKTNASDIVSRENLDSVLKEIVNDFNDPKIVYSFDCSHIEVKIIKRLFKIALSNIIANGLFEIKNQDNGSVNISVSKSEEYFSIAITDSANSLLKEDLDNIFTPFFSKKNINDGCGLGLSVTRDILDNIGADIFVSLHPTTFLIRFSLNDVKLVA